MIKFINREGGGFYAVERDKAEKIRVAYHAGHGIGHMSMSMSVDMALAVGNAIIEIATAPGPRVASEADWNGIIGREG